MGRKAILGWLEQSGLGYDHLKDAPKMYEYAVAIKRDNIAVLWHRSDGVVELQCTPTFNDDITKDFFALHATSRDNIVSRLREKMLGLEIRHNIVVSEKERIFGFTLRIYLPNTLSQVDLLNSHGRISEIRNVVGQSIIQIMREEAAV